MSYHFAIAREQLTVEGGLDTYSNDHATKTIRRGVKNGKI